MKAPRNRSPLALKGVKGNLAPAGRATIMHGPGVDLSRPSARMVERLENFIALAAKGHKDDARRAARIVADMLEKRQELPDVARQYLIDGLHSIGAGNGAAEAFHAGGRKGVKDRLPKGMSKHLVPVMMAQALINSGQADNIHQAAMKVSMHLGQPDASTIEKAWRESFKPD